MLSTEFFLHQKMKFINAKLLDLKEKVKVSNKNVINEKINSRNKFLHKTLSTNSVNYIGKNMTSQNLEDISKQNESKYNIIIDNYQKSFEMFKLKITNYEEDLQILHLSHQILNNTRPITHDVIEALDNLGDKLFGDDDYGVILLIKGIEKYCVNPIDSNYFSELLNRYVFNEKIFDHKLYDYNPVTGRANNPTIQYWHNTAWSSIEKWEVEGSKLSEDERNLFSNAEILVKEANASMVSKVQSLGRYAHIGKELRSLLYLSQAESSFDALTNVLNKYQLNAEKHLKTSFDLVGMQVIGLILSKFGIIPWEFRFNRYFKRAGIDSPCVLPTLIVALMNLAIQEFFNNITYQEAVYGAMNIIEMCYGSFIDNALRVKGPNRSFERELRKKLNLFGILLYNQGMCSGKIGIQQLPEINSLSFEDEIIDDNDISIGTKILIAEFRKLSNDLFKEGTIAQAAINTETLRRMIFVLRCISTPSIYNHGSVLLSEIKSAAPKLEKMINLKIPPMKRVFIDGTPYTYRLNFNEAPLFFKQGSIWFDNNIKSLMLTINKSKRNINYQSEFVSALTNRSQGEKLPETMKTLVPAKLYNTSQNRTINFLYSINDFFSVSTLQTAASVQATIGTRSQIDRRYRPIDMISNAGQVGSFGSLAKLNQFKPYVSGIAAGKQIGTIEDMLIQLESTDGHNIISSADISGADNYTLRPHKDFVDMKLLELYENEDVLFYFPYTPSSCLVQDIKTGSEQTITLNAMEQCMLVDRSLNIISNKVYYDQHFKRDVLISTEGFQSGKFGTATQHTLCLQCGLRGIHDYWCGTFGKSLLMRESIMGDDMLIVLNTINEKITSEYFEYFHDRLLEVNYKTELSPSRYQCVFLQLDSLCGTYLPSPFRISLVTTERGDTVRRSSFERLQSMRSIVQQYGTRSYSEANGQQFIRAVWETLRWVKINNDTQISKSFESISRMTSFGKALCYSIYGSNVRLCRNGMFATSLITKDKESLDIKPHTSHLSLDGDGAIMDYQVTFGNINAVINVMSKGALTIDKVLDVGLMEKYGILQTLFASTVNLETQVTEARREDIGIEVLDQLTVNLELFQDQAMRFTSMAANQQLERYGIKLPDHLIYFKRPRQRVDSAIQEPKLSKTEVENVYLEINKVLSEEKYKKWKNSHNVLQHLLLGLIEFKKIGTIGTSNVQISEELSIAPNAHKGSESLELLKTTGYIFNHLTKEILSLGKYVNTYAYGAESNLLELVDEGVKLYNLRKSDDLLYLLGNAYGLNESSINSLIIIVHRRAQDIPLLEFKVITSNQGHFYRSIAISNYRRNILIDWRNADKRIKRKGINLIYILFRDMLFKYPHENYQLRNGLFKIDSILVNKIIGYVRGLR